jgi:hypothetical protein
MSGSECDICGGSAVGIVSSTMGAISFAICGACSCTSSEPWTIVVGGLIGMRRDNIAPKAQSVNHATSEAYDRTEDQLWAEVAEMDRQYDEYMRRQGKTD